MHLTNNAIQVKSKEYGKFENGNQISYYEFEKYLKNNKINMNFRQKIVPKMREIIALTYEGAK